ncbi:hypothetical protein FH608_040865 [Nonomuraea phyllanthi]|uniref:CU044_5270 family protein n=1 Tax=Nonomuraea phyllanthi TaxID=2219224 RepID=A0A5C4VJ37_9ACTN|nr:CU044_5270 family protein [Nonomuraea phyllanthi]KAB8189192.1 hypothetical protein FH608_040865 [Nonomuraea phyllanthi]
MSTIRDFRRDTPPMTAQAESTARARLLAAVREHEPHREPRLGPRLGRRLVLAGALAVAIGAGVVVADDHPRVALPGATPVPGRDVLLMAAASAEHIPQGTGTYWHIMRTWQGPDAPQMQESWTTRDGRHWSRNEPDAAPGAVVEDPASFRLMGAEIGFEELEGLPTDPEELKERIAELPQHDSAMFPGERQGELVSPLVTLITELPTPAQVRAAAFEALAATPGIKNAGPVEGGQALLIPLSGSLEIRMVVDPEAARVARANILLTAEGGAAMSNSYVSVTTEWTDELPR